MLLFYSALRPAYVAGRDVGIYNILELLNPLAHSNGSISGIF